LVLDTQNYRIESDVFERLQHYIQMRVKWGNGNHPKISKSIRYFLCEKKKYLFHAKVLVLFPFWGCKKTE
jgi:hypothetical protein